MTTLWPPPGGPRPRHACFLSGAWSPDLLGRFPGRHGRVLPSGPVGMFTAVCGKASGPLWRACPWYLVQEVLQAAGLQREPGHPVWLCGVQAHEDSRVVVPGDALLWEVELVDEAEDVATGQKGVVSGAGPSVLASEHPGEQSPWQLPSKGSVPLGCLWDLVEAVSGPALGGHSTDKGEAAPSLWAWRGHSSVSAGEVGLPRRWGGTECSILGGLSLLWCSGGPWPV